MINLLGTVGRLLVFFTAAAEETAALVKYALKSEGSKAK